MADDVKRLIIEPAARHERQLLIEADLFAAMDRCTEIADQVEPRYRCGPRSYSCTGHVAKLWQAAWDGACVALGGNPDDFKGLPE